MLMLRRVQHDRSSKLFYHNAVKHELRCVKLALTETLTMLVTLNHPLLKRRFTNFQVLLAEL